MTIRRIALFLSLLLLCTAAAAINLNQSTRLEYYTGFLDTFLAVNPWLYAALTLLIAGGFLHRRRRAFGKSTPCKTAAGVDLTPAEQLLMRKIYLEKLKSVQERATGVEGKLLTPHGRHFIRELNRIFDRMQEEHRTITDELASSEAQHRKIIEGAERSIEKAREASKESKLLLRSSAIDRKEYKNLQLEYNSTIKKCRRRISEVNAVEKKSRKVHFITRLQFMRRGRFLAHLHRAYIDRQQSAMKAVQGHAGLFHPKIAKNDLRRRKIADRKRNRVNEKMVRLEERREKINGLVYREKMKSLLKEKKIRDKALLDIIGKISDRMDLCSNKKERLESAIQTLTYELADMKTLGRIQSLFPALVRVQRAKIRKAIKSARKALPDLRKIETIYNEMSSGAPDPLEI